ncbi:hypothetical protein ACQ4LE_011119 [Meloidogyne hapla]
MCAAYAVMHGGPVLRPDQMEKNIRRLPELPRRIVPVSSTDDLSLKLLNAKPVWSLLNFANWHSYWPYRYLSDPYSHEMYWHDPHSLHSPLHKRELFGKNKPNVDYIANNHYWNYPYPYWARYRGYIYDYANPSFYSKEYDLNYFEI